MGQGKSRGDQAPSPRPVGIFWDMKSCQIPAGVNLADLAKNVRAALRDHLSDYDLKEFFAYGDASVFPRDLLRRWERDGMKVDDVGGSCGDYKRMLIHMVGLALDYTSPRRAVIVLISGDSLPQAFLMRLYLYGYPVLLVSPSCELAPSSFVTFPGFLLDWLFFARGSGKIFPKDDQQSIGAQDRVDKEPVEGTGEHIKEV